MWHVRRRGEVYTGFWWGYVRERDHLKDRDVDGSSGSGMGGMEWIDLAQDR